MLALLQQSPRSNSHSSLLLTSSQYPSPIQPLSQNILSGINVTGFVVVVAVVVVVIDIVVVEPVVELFVELFVVVVVGLALKKHSFSFQSIKI
jgi:hypothetical protein